MEDVTTLADLMDVMAKRQFSACRIFTTYDGGLSPFAAPACAASAFNGGDIQLSFMPANEADVFAEFAGKEILLPPARPAFAFAL